MVDHSGEKFGEWTIIEKIDTEKYLAKCSCGTEKIVFYNNLKRGLSTNCGCIQNEKCRKRMTTHGKSKSKIYMVWAGMKRRCYNPNQKSYPDYGGRGIKMCDDWKENFESFYKWSMENGYIEGEVEIDRIDVNGNYCPENCRWISKKKNMNNKRNNTIVKYRNKNYTLSELADKFDIKEGLIIERLQRGWDIEDAVLPTFAKGDGKFKPLYTEVRGENLTLEEIALKYELNLGCVKSRYQKGLRGEDLIQSPTPKNIPKKILCYDLNGNFIKEFESIKLASKELNIGRSTISNICNGKIKKPKKYIFKFKEEC